MKRRSLLACAAVLAAPRIAKAQARRLLRVIPEADENTCGFFETATTSSCLVIAQKPWFGAGSGCQCTGSSRRSNANSSWRTCSSHNSGVIRSTRLRSSVGVLTREA